jgi:hypothetical protein
MRGLLVKQRMQGQLVAKRDLLMLCETALIQTLSNASLGPKLETLSVRRPL